jgi:alpha-muurolene/germacrene-A/gamma-muurolene synthase
MCHNTIGSFAKLRSELPSWGGEVDEMARLYVQGLQDWIVGCVDRSLYLVSQLNHD